jgi:hypothetical protein
VKFTRTDLFKIIIIILVPFVVAGLSMYICEWVNSHEESADNTNNQPGTSGHEPQKYVGDERKERWEEYKIHVDLFKYYLDLVLRTNIAVFAILGAILTFYFKNKGENKHLKKALLLPCVLTLSLGGFYIYSACLWRNVSITVNTLRAGLGILATPYVHILSLLLLLFGIVFLGIGDALIWFMWKDKVENREPPNRFE